MDRDHATTLADDAPSLVSPPQDGHAPHRQGWTQRYAAGRTEDEVRGDVWRDFDLGWVMVCELIGATFTWGGIGWLADRWLGTEPLLLSLGFVLGFMTGFYLLWARTTGRVTARKPQSRETAPASPETTAASPETTAASPETAPASPETAPASPETAPASPETTAEPHDAAPATSGVRRGA